MPWIPYRCWRFAQVPVDSVPSPHSMIGVKSDVFHSAPLEIRDRLAGETHALGPRRCRGKIARGHRRRGSDVDVRRGGTAVGGAVVRLIRKAVQPREVSVRRVREGAILAEGERPMRWPRLSCAVSGPPPTSVSSASTP